MRKITFRTRLFPLAASAFLFGCVGGSLSDTKAFEMYPLRSASDSESEKLKTCLRAAHQAQNLRKQETGKYARKVRDLSLDADCSNFMMSQHPTRTGYEILAELRESETTVRWSVNEKNVIEEHLDPESEGDLEF